MFYVLLTRRIFFSFPLSTQQAPQKSLSLSPEMDGCYAMTFAFRCRIWVHSFSQRCCDFKTRPCNKLLVVYFYKMTLLLNYVQQFSGFIYCAVSQVGFSVCLFVSLVCVLQNPNLYQLHFGGPASKHWFSTSYIAPGSSIFPFRDIRIIGWSPCHLFDCETWKSFTNSNNIPGGWKWHWGMSLILYR